MQPQRIKPKKPVTHAEKALKYTERALEIVRQRLAANPGREEYIRIISEIEYVKAALIEPGTDRSKLRNFTFGNGHSAAFFESHGIDGSESLERKDPDLYHVVCGMRWVASTIASGLKMDLHVLEELLQSSVTKS